MVLIMTLAALAVMMILLLALFVGASHQMRGAQGDASLAREKLLADSAVGAGHRPNSAGLLANRAGLDFPARPAPDLRRDGRRARPPPATNSTRRRNSPA